MSKLLTQLNQQFSIDGSLLIKQHSNDGLLFIEVTNSHASAIIQLQGAHLTKWTPNNSQPVIWLSSAAKFTLNKSIRGGIPICWPWFGAHQTSSDYPAHGFARTVQWTIVSTQTLSSGDTQIILSLPKANIPESQWAIDTQLECIFTIGKSLELELITHNHSSEDCIISEALHTYFNVSDVRNSLIDGLDDCEYLDKLDNFKRKIQSGNVEIKHEVDRVYVSTTHDCIIEDLAFNRRIIISKKGSASTIVWNPWQETAAKMGDLGDEGYLNMICVESGNAAQDVVTVESNQKHSLYVRYSIENID